MARNGKAMLRSLHEARIGHEARLRSDDHQALKLWLRLLACTTQIETEIRRRLRIRFGISLARFDYMAQLQRNLAGLKMNTLSRYLMVTGGNVTGLTDELVREGLVVRDADPSDRRAYRVRLTGEGVRAFQAMAAEHEEWVIELFDGLNQREKIDMRELLAKLRLHLAANDSANQENP